MTITQRQIVSTLSDSVSQQYLVLLWLSCWEYYFSANKLVKLSQIVPFFSFFHGNIFQNIIAQLLMIRSHCSPSGEKTPAVLLPASLSNKIRHGRSSNNKTWPTLGKWLSFGEVARTSKEFFEKALSCLWNWVVFFALMGCYHSAAYSCRYWLMRRTFVVVPGNTRLIIHWRGLNPRSSWVGAKKWQRNLWKPPLKGLFLNGKKNNFFLLIGYKTECSKHAKPLKAMEPHRAAAVCLQLSAAHEWETSRQLRRSRRRRAAVKCTFLSLWSSQQICAPRARNVNTGTCTPTPVSSCWFLYFCCKGCRTNVQHRIFFFFFFHWRLLERLWNLEARYVQHPQVFPAAPHCVKGNH